AGLELRQALEGDGAAEAPAAAEMPRAAEDLVVGQDTDRRIRALEDEPGGERLERERGARWRAAVPAEQLLEPLELAHVVAQDQRVLAARGASAEEGGQAVHVPVDGLGRADVEAQVAVGTDPEAAEAGEAARHVVRWEEQRVRRLGLAVAGLDGRAMETQDLVPGAAELSRRGIRLELDHDGVARQDIEQRAAHDRSIRPRSVLGGAEVHGQDLDALQVAGRTLVEDVEAADRRHLVAPELDAHGVRGAEAEEVEDP